MPTSYSSTDQEDPEQPPDNRHPNNDSSNSRNGENWQSASETDSLLAKNNGDNSGDDRTEDENHESSGGLLGTIVEGVEYIAEHAQEAATEFKEAIAEQAHLVVEEMEHMAENASEIAHDIGVAIAEEAIDVKDHLVDNLVDKDGGESIMFEMGLVRNLSMLPQDIEEIAHSHPTHDDNDEEDTILPEGAGVFDCCPQSIKSCCRLQVETEKTKLVDEAGHVSIIEKTKGGTPFHAYITLIGAVVCLSSIGPSLDMQGGVASSMKIYWRMTGTYVVLFPLALKSAMHTGFPTLTNVQLCTFGLAAFCYAVMCVAFVLALEYTSVGNAVIFANSQSLLLLVGKMVVGQAVSYMEGSGALVAFSGAILCATDSSASTGNTFSTDTSASVVWAGVGDLLALLSAIGGVGYLVFAKTLREHVPNVFVFMFMIMFAGSMAVLLYLWVSGEYFTFNRDINVGLWGWMNLQSDRLPLEIWMVCVCNLMGAMGYVRSMQYFDNLIISVATLMEPVVASVMAYFLNVGLLPGWVGWVGNLLVVFGTAAVVYPNSGGKDAAGGH